MLLAPSRAIGVLLGAVVCLTAPGVKAARPSCAAHPNLTVADFSMPVTEVQAGTKNALDTLKQFGIGTIIRYYDHDTETIDCKTLLPEESDAILAGGFRIAVVFQHNNGDPETFFSKTRGAEDAKRSLALAAANGQPFGSTIYFGVDGADQVIKDMVYEYGRSHGKPMTEARKKALLDGDPSLRRHIRFYARFLEYKDQFFKDVSVNKLRARHILPFVESYFADVNRVFQEATAGAPDNGSYSVGAYGSGLVCTFLLSKKLVKYCWLAQSNGWPDYDSFKSSMQWSLLQEKPTACPSWTYAREKKRKVEFDFNTPNPANADFGQWSEKRPDVVPITRPKTCPPLAQH